MFDHIPSGPPSMESWEARRRTFDELWLEAMYVRSTTTSQHVANLRTELERCYCAGAWIACIVLSAAIVEIHLSNLGGWKSPEARQILETLNVVDEWEKLKLRRNMLIHGTTDDQAQSRLPSDHYINRRNFLEQEATEATGLALRVALSDLRFQ